MKKKLSLLVKHISDADYSQAELVQFINMTQKISLGYLKFLQINGKRISSERGNMEAELEDLATDCIADLFAGGEQGEFPQLTKYYTTNCEAIEALDDYEILALTKRLVIRKTKQELSRVFRERDPEGAKVVRNIRVAIRSIEGLETFKELGKIFLYFEKNSQTFKRLQRSKLPITEEWLHANFVGKFDTNEPIPTIIRNIFSIVEKADEYQDYIAFDILVKFIRNVKYQNFYRTTQESAWVPTPHEQFELMEIEQFVDQVMITMKKKIFAKYEKSGKLSTPKADVYHQALRDVLFDLVEKKSSTSYYKNLKNYLPGLTQRQYRQNERSVFEYLAKVAKKDFQTCLKQML